MARTTQISRHEIAPKRRVYKPDKLQLPKRRGLFYVLWTELAGRLALLLDGCEIGTGYFRADDR
jgi:hypothetical protein